ncbi:MAG: hypothetical protein NT042_03625 [Sulfuritalea sp.]|nr:hypothetical protein [Sulfuritalea sp.]
MTVAQSTRTYLTLYLTGGYLLLIIYASLYPLAGWHDSGICPSASFARRHCAAAWRRSRRGWWRFCSAPL